MEHPLSRSRALVICVFLIPFWIVTDIFDLIAVNFHKNNIIIHLKFEINFIQQILYFFPNDVETLPFQYI